MTRLWCQWFSYMIDVMSWCACIFIFSEVVEYLYTHMIEIWCRWASYLDVPVYVYSLKLWNICMLVWLGYDVNGFHIWLMLCLDVPVYLYSPKLWNICMLVWLRYDVVELYIWMCLYTYILRSCRIYVCSYNQAMRSLICVYNVVRFSYLCVPMFTLISYETFLK
jgi:hypothetical protein